MSSEVNRKLSESLATVSLSTSSNAAQKESTNCCPSPASLPATLTRSYEILSIPTDAYCQIFSDRIVLGVSQLDQRIGTWLLCESQNSETNPDRVEYPVSTLLGLEDVLLEVYARQITEKIRMASSSSPSIVLVLGISLDKKRGKDTKMFRLLVETLAQLYSDTAQL